MVFIPVDGGTAIYALHRVATVAVIAEARDLQKSVGMVAVNGSAAMTKR